MTIADTRKLNYIAYVTLKDTLFYFSSLLILLDFLHTQSHLQVTVFFLHNLIHFFSCFVAVSRISGIVIKDKPLSLPPLWCMKGEGSLYSHHQIFSVCFVIKQSDCHNHFLVCEMFFFLNVKSDGLKYVSASSDTNVPFILLIRSIDLKILNDTCTSEINLS